MKAIIRLLLLGLLPYQLSAQSNNENIDQTVDSILASIESQNTKGLFDLASMNFSANYDEEHIDSLLHDIKIVADMSGLDKISKVKSNHSSKTTMSNGIWTSTITKTYNLIPSYFGKFTETMMQIDLGYDLSITIENIDNNWKLRRIELTNHYDESKNLIGDFYSLLENSKILKYRYVIVSIDKMSIAGDGEIKSDSIKVLATKINVNCIKQPVVKELEAKTLYSFSLKSMNPNVDSFLRKHAPNDFFSNTKNKSRIDYFEILFTDNPKMYFLSNGNKYSFCRSSELNPISSLIKSLLIE